MRVDPAIRELRPASKIEPEHNRFPWYSQAAVKPQSSRRRRKRDPPVLLTTSRQSVLAWRSCVAIVQILRKRTWDRSRQRVAASAIRYKSSFVG